MKTPSALPFGQMLAQLKKEAGISWIEITHRAWQHGLEISEPSLRNYATGRTKGSPQMRRETFEAIAAALDQPPEVFAEYRMKLWCDQLDPKVVGFETALATLEAIEGGAPTGLPPLPPGLKPSPAGTRRSAKDPAPRSSRRKGQKP